MGFISCVGSSRCGAEPGLALLAVEVRSTCAGAAESGAAGGIVRRIGVEGANLRDLALP